MALTIERATVADVPVLSALGKETFLKAFVGVSYYTFDIIGGYVEKAFAPEVLEAEFADAKVAYFLARENGVVAGYAKTEERPSAECLGPWRGLYLSRFYFAAAFQRRGFGGILLAEVRREALARGYSGIWLSVWEHNASAQAFYLKHGFREAGEWEWKYESHGVKYVDCDYVMKIEFGGQN